MTETPSINPGPAKLITCASGQEILLVPYVHNIGASRGDITETVGVAFCLQFPDNAAAVKFAQESGFDKERIGCPGVVPGAQEPLKDNQMCFRGVCCAPDVVEMVFQNISHVMNALEGKGIRIDERSKEEVREFYYSPERYQKPIAVDQSGNRSLAVSLGGMGWE